jgi:hypothetical protein
VIRKLATIMSYQTLRVDEPEAATSLVLGETFLDEVLHDLLSNTDTSGASAKEHSPLIFGRSSRLLDSVNEAGQNHGASTLNIVVEHGVCVLVALEGRKWVLEVLVLNDDAGPSLSESSHHLV